MFSTISSTDAFSSAPAGPLPDLAEYPHLVCIKRLGICTADGRHPLARVLDWFDRTGDVEAVSASLGIPPEAVDEVIRYASELTGQEIMPDTAGIASDEPVFGGSGTVTGPRDLDDYPRLIRTKDRVVRTAERAIPVSQVRMTFGDLGDITEAASVLDISPEAASEAVQYANLHFVESY